MNFYKKALSPELIARAYQRANERLPEEKFNFFRMGQIRDNQTNSTKRDYYADQTEKAKNRVEKKIKQRNLFQREMQKNPSTSLVPYGFFDTPPKTESAKSQNINKALDTPPKTESAKSQNINKALDTPPKTESPKEQNLTKALDGPKPKDTPEPTKEKSHLGRNLAIGAAGLGAVGLGAYLWKRHKKKQALQKSAAGTGLGLAARALQYGIKGVGSRISQGISKFTGNAANVASAGNMANLRFQRAGQLFNQAKQINPNIKRHIGLGIGGTALAGAGMYGALSNNNQN